MPHLMKPHSQPYEHLLSQDSGAALKPISLVTACRRLGMLFDLWHINPVKIVDLLEQAPGIGCQRHPLRGLFDPYEEPPPPDASAAGGFPRPDSVTGTLSVRRLGRALGRKRPAFEVGDEVKARFSEESQELLAHDQNGEKYFDSSRQWHSAVVERDNGDGTFCIQWENGYGGKDTLKKQEEMIQAYKTDETRDGVRFLLAAQGYREGFHMRQVWRIFLLGLCVLGAAELATEIFHDTQDPFENCDRNIPASIKMFCEAAETAVHLMPHAYGGAGIAITLLCFLFCSVVGLVVLPLTFRALYCCFPSLARRLMCLSLNICLDPPRVYLLPNVYGPSELLLVLLAATALLSCVCISVILLTVGLIPLGIMWLRYTMSVGNALCGEKSGLQQVRMFRILALLERHRVNTNVALDKEHLRMELEKLLASPFNCGVLSVSLPFLTLIASALFVPEADSWRLKTVLVSRAYADFRHEPKNLAELKRMYDVAVNMFDGTCAVPGVNLEGERWNQQGWPIPWHLSLYGDAMQTTEEELSALGLQPGDGCFTWRSTRSGLWHTRESEDPSLWLDAARRRVKGYARLDRTLNVMALDFAVPDDPDLFRPLLRAGADPNFAPVRRQSSLYRACAAGKLQTAKLLIEYKGDVNMESESGDTPITIDAKANQNFERIRADLLRFIAEKRG